ncbi:hypothetical protein AB4622_26740 [Vibrio splendidus]
MKIGTFRSTEFFCNECKKEYQESVISTTLKCMDSNCAEPIYAAGSDNNGDEYVVKLLFAKDIKKDEIVYLMRAEPQSYIVTGTNMNKNKVHVGLKGHGSERFGMKDIVACLA